jgi:hypothetical protein
MGKIPPTGTISREIMHAMDASKLVWKQWHEPGQAVVEWSARSSTESTCIVCAGNHRVGQCCITTYR